jgi:UDP-N-acetylmuramyl pentapeptide synthase
VKRASTSPGLIKRPGFRLGVFLMTTAISLPDLLRGLPEQLHGPVPSVMISGVTQDSRQVQPGYLFVAVIGGSADGHRYIPDAIHRGAAAVVGSQELSDLPVPSCLSTITSTGLPIAAHTASSPPVRHDRRLVRMQDTTANPITDLTG